MLEKVIGLNKVQGIFLGILGYIGIIIGMSWINQKIAILMGIIPLSIAMFGMLGILFYWLYKALGNEWDE